MALFKKCSDYGAKMAQNNDHEAGLLCLGEGHDTTSYPACKSLTPKAKEARALRLKAGLWEQGQKALEGKAAQQAAKYLYEVLQ